jgi:KaiC/GvpD/RAD55 family RecA-like ATPase
MARILIDADEVLNRLDFTRFYESELGVSLKLHGAEALTRCPFHDDKSPSLTINVEKGVWNCQAGCGAGNAYKFFEKKHGVDFKAALVCLAEMAGVEDKPKDIKPKEVKAYAYKDATGAVVYEKVRYEPKTFKIRRPDGKGGFIWSLGDTKQILYNLLEVRRATFVVICEGEKDADNVRALGFTATTNVGGAGKWLPEFTETLKGKHIAILLDNDEAGIKHGDLVGAALKPVAASVCTVMLKGLPPKGDVSDWINARKSAGMEQQIIYAEIKAIFEAEPEWSAPSEAQTAVRIIHTRAADILQSMRRKKMALKASGKAPGIPVCDKFKHCLPYWMPTHMHVFSGYTSHGKSTLLADVLYDTAPHGAKVMVFTVEDSSDSKAARFIGCHAGISLRRILAMEDFTRDWQAKYDEAEKWLSEWNPLIYDQFRSIDEIRKEVEAEKMRNGVDIVAIDYAQKIYVKGAEGIYDQMREVSRLTFDMTMDLEVCTIILSQVNNESMREGNMLNGLKGGGDLGEAADSIIRMERKNKFKPEVEIYIEKNRQFGVTDSIAATFNSSYTRIITLNGGSE